jgi:hypothetical protein
MDFPLLTKASLAEIFFRIIGIGSLVQVFSVIFCFQFHGLSGWVGGLTCAFYIFIGTPCLLYALKWEDERIENYESDCTEYLFRKTDEAQAKCEPIPAPLQERVEKRVKEAARA